MSRFIYKDKGVIRYQEALEEQKQLFDALLAKKVAHEEGISTLLFCEHEPVFTLGKHGKRENLLISEEYLQSQGISLHTISRGGDITFHGPGQITGYPIFDLEQFDMGLKQYIHTLEEIVIDFLSAYGIKGYRVDSATGVWIDSPDGHEPRKICAIGVKSSRFVTMHGFALNINTPLHYYSMINPCGFTDRGVTSLETELGRAVSMAEAKEKMLELFLRYFR